jgi:hypothetical protein
MRPFKFFGDKIEFTETIPAPVDVTIHRAIITSRVITFIECRDEMMYRQPDSQYVYGGYTSFTRDNIEYHCVRTLNDFLLGRNFDNYILLHDAQEIEELGYIVANLEQRGATQMF